MHKETALPESVERVARLLRDIGHEQPVLMLASSGKTCAQAAASLGCDVGEIAKSIVFKRLGDDAAVMVIASGADRIDEAKVAAIAGPIGKADARFVKERTGYAIGGVCPIGHVNKSVILIDEKLFGFASVWVAAGHPHSVFNLTPAQLQAMTGAPTVDVSDQDGVPGLA